MVISGDDGNENMGDGCENCQIQIGWSCSEMMRSGGTYCTQTCGNNITDNGMLWKFQENSKKVKLQFKKFNK